MNATVEIPDAARAEYDEMYAELIGDGYEIIPEHRGLRPGLRVRHTGEQWAKAVLYGTGVIAVIGERADSPWSRQHNAADIEMLVVRDDGSRSWWVSRLAQYHVGRVVYQRRPGAKR